MNHKRSLVDKLRRFSVGNMPAYIVASTGRAGSSLLYHAVGDAILKKRPIARAVMPVEFVKSRAWDLDENNLLGGVVYKTHDFPGKALTEVSSKTIFVFGLASDAAISVLSCRSRYGDDWVNAHLMNLNANGGVDELCARDVMRIGEQVAAWASYREGNVIAVRYEALWDNVDKLSDFLELNIKLPNKIPRQGGEMVGDAIKREIKESYSAVDGMIASLPDLFLPPIS